MKKIMFAMISLLSASDYSDEAYQAFVEMEMSALEESGYTDVILPSGQYMHEMDSPLSNGTYMEAEYQRILDEADSLPEDVRGEIRQYIEPGLEMMREWRQGVELMGPGMMRLMNSRF